MFGILLAMTLHTSAPVADAATAAAAAVDTHLAGRSIEIYEVLDHHTPRYVRNTNCWAAGFDLTSIAVFNSHGFGLSTNACCPHERATRRAGTLISPRHILYANHYEIPHGTQLRFVTRLNTIVTGTLAKSVAITNTDLRVGALRANLPAHLIRPAKVLPADFQEKFPVGLKGLPALGLNQLQQATLANIATTTATHITFAAPAEPERNEFYRAKVSGDSGQPAFLILDGDLVLLTVFTGGGAGSGFFITRYIPEINAAMKQLGGGHQLTPVDLRRFPPYNPAPKSHDQ